MTCDRPKSENVLLTLNNILIAKNIFLHSKCLCFELYISKRRRRRGLSETQLPQKCKQKPFEATYNVLGMLQTPYWTATV